MMMMMMRHVLYLAFGLALGTYDAAGYNSSKLHGRLLKGLITDESSAVVGGAAHECYRTCVEGDTRVCNYEFVMNAYTTMAEACGDCPYNVADCYNRGCITAGGEVREIKVANHMMPGPSIQVCKGDTIRVLVVNAFGGESITIHWHGMKQNGTPFMDGVPYLTQCPLLPANSFVYNFTADPIGTHMWHSHVGIQEPDGFYGSLIVRAANDSLAKYYDYDLPDHTIVIWHWYGVLTSSIIKSTFFKSTTSYGHSITINGMTATTNYTLDGVTYMTPRANFTVKQGYRYRFRSIGNMGIYCPVQVSVDDHTLLIIASDGASIEPIEVESYVINAGERYDFVVHANQSVGNYLMKFRGLGKCENTSVSATAFLHYENATEADQSETVTYAETQRSGLMLNPAGLSSGFPNNTCIELSDLENTSENAPDVSGEPDYRFYWNLAFNEYDYFDTPGPYAQMNGRSFDFPPIPLLTQYREVTDEMACMQGNFSNAECCERYCTCPMVYAVELGSLVEMVIFDNSSIGNDSHPMHMHGGQFSVVAMETEGDGTSILEDIKARNENGSIAKNCETAPLKDTIGIPAHGLAVVRIVADNPGYWFFHCHVSVHTEEGMGVVLKIGDDSEMSHPPDDFPKCGNYDITGSPRSF